MAQHNQLYYYPEYHIIIFSYNVEPTCLTPTSLCSNVMGTRNNLQTFKGIVFELAYLMKLDSTAREMIPEEHELFVLEGVVLGSSEVLGEELAFVDCLYYIPLLF